ncbi:MAG: PAS domain S-box protein [Balneolaceae bacterium]|nr:MAG: PAS domain S-box protein [Balneolaceae bacterium]
MAEKANGHKINTKELFFNFTTEMACIAGFDGYFKELNPAWSRVLGWSTEELLSKPWNDFVHPDDVEATSSAAASVIDGQEVYTFENRYICKDGTFKWPSWNSRPYPEEGIMFGVARDITVQKGQTLELEKQHEKLVKLTNQMPGVVYEFQLFPDGRMHFPFASSGMDYIFGHTPEEVRLNGQLAFKKVHPDDIERVYKETFFSAENLTQFYCEFRVLLSDGRVEWRLCDATPERLEDGSTLWYGMIIDITSQKRTEEALKQSEKSYRLLFENNPHPMWVYNVETLKFIEVNEAVAQKYGYSREEFLSMTILDIRPKEDAEKILEHIRNDREELSFSGEWQHQRKNGELFWVEVISHKLIYKNQNAKLVLLNDITERRKAVNELKESEFLLNEAQKVTKLGSWNFDFRNDVLTWSDGLYDVFDVDRASFKETHGSFLSLIDEEDRERAQKVSRNTQQTGEPFHIIYGITTPNGEQRKIEEYGFAEKNESGNVVRLYGTAQNVTERLKFQEQMLNSDRIFRYASDMLCIVGFDGYFKVVNPAWTKTLGWSEDELLSKPYREFVHPDDVEQTKQEGEKVVSGEGSLDFENRYLCKDGSYRWLSWKSFPFTDEQKVYAVVRDITKQKEVKHSLIKLSTAVEQNPASIVITDLDGIIEYVNPAFTNLTGYTAEEVIGENPRILQSGFQSEALYKNLWETISKGNVWRGELLNKKKNDKHYWEFATITPICDKNGSIINYLAIKEDITKQKKSQKEKERFEAIVEESEFGLAISNIEGEIIYINRFFANIHGYDPEDLMGKPLSIFHTDEIITEVNTLLKQLMDDGYFEATEIMHLHKEGHTFPMLMNGVLLRDEFGKPEFMAASALDLTKYKQAQQKLFESEVRLKTLSDNIPNGFVYEINTGIDGSIRQFDYISAGIEELVGVTAEQVMEDPMQLYSRFCNEDAQILAQKEKEAITKLSTLVAEVGYTNVSGTLNWLFISSSPRKNEHAELVWDGIAIDITRKKQIEQEIKESEQKFQIVSENTYHWEFWEKEDGSY